MGTVFSGAAEAAEKTNNAQESKKIDEEKRIIGNDLLKNLRDAVNDKDLGKIESVSFQISDYIKKYKLLFY